MDASPKLLALLFAAVALGACTVRGLVNHEARAPEGRAGHAQAHVEPGSNVEITSAPLVDYRNAPQTVYDGRTVYLIDDWWGYPSGDDGWVVYRVEPAPLARFRLTIQSAPPAPRTEERTAPPPEQGRERQLPPVSAPPATHTR